MKKVLTLILFIAILGFCRTAFENSGYRPFEIIKHDVNQVECYVSNYGKFGQSPQGNSGLSWPKGTGNTYIFGAGSWFGTIVDGKDTLVTIGYGPHGGEAEYTPGLQDMSSGDPNAKIWIYPTAWPPPAEIFPMAPQVNKSHQDSWCAYNDLDINNHMPGDTKPIGLEVYQTVYAWNLSTTKDIIFIKYQLKNISGEKLTNCYFGVCTDNDIGNESGTNANDIISGIVGQWYVIDGESIWVDNLGYQWQASNEPGWDSTGAIGFDYLQSPWDLKEGQDKDQDGIPDQYEMDSAYYADNVPPTQWDVDADGTPDWRDPSEIPQMGMTAFKRFTLNLEPNKDNERYVTLAGYNFKTGNYEPYDTIPPQSDDQRFLQCSGPFDIEADSTAIVLVGVMLTYWNMSHARPDTELVKVDRTVQEIYDKNWLLPGPPPPPILTCVPGDAKVTLVWDNYSETAADPYYDVVSKPGSNYDPYYKKYDFEGYRVWRSLTGKTGTWKLLASYDLANGITFIDTTMADSIALQATDVGLLHSYVDYDVRNGFNYYYAVTAFDYNYIKQPPPDSFRAIWFESGLSGINAAPRREPANLMDGKIESITLLSGNPRLLGSVGAQITYPLNMTGDLQFVKYSPIIRDTVSAGCPQYTAYLLDKDSVPVDSFKVVMPLDTVAHTMFYEFAERNGLNTTAWFIKSKTKGNVAIFDSVTKESGSYPDSFFSVVARAVNWAYRGNDFEVHWRAKNSGGPVNTVTVIDRITGDTIPYKPYLENTATDTLADGWCFRSSTQTTDTIVYGNASTGTRALYICSGKIGIARGWFDTEPRPSENDVWVVHASAAYAPAPFKALFEIQSSPSTMLTDTTLTLNVKVVPNPYLVGNEWQQSSLIRRLKFINLPDECTIRIFTTNGELIKTIVHKATIGSVKGDAGGDEWWDVLTDNRQIIASGVYIFHVDSKVGEQVGKFVIIR